MPEPLFIVENPGVAPSTNILSPFISPREEPNQTSDLLEPSTILAFSATFRYYENLLHVDRRRERVKIY